MTTTNRSGEEREARTGTTPAATGGEKTARLEICHPSVCVGGATPTNCVCPTPTKK